MRIVETKAAPLYQVHVAESLASNDRHHLRTEAPCFGGITQFTDVSRYLPEEGYEKDVDSGLRETLQMIGTVNSFRALQAHENDDDRRDEDAGEIFEKPDAIRVVEHFCGLNDKRGGTR